MNCLTCNKNFGTKAGIIAHCLAKGHQCKFKPCTTCGQFYAEGGPMENHCRAKGHVIASHRSVDLATGEAAYVGDTQSLSLPFTPGTTQPEPAQSKKSKCGMCNKVFQTDTALQNHSRAKHHLPKNETKKPIPHTCFTCQKTFITLQGLENHCNEQTHQANPYICRLCSLSFATSEGLQSHTNTSFAHKKPRQSYRSRKTRIVPKDQEDLPYYDSSDPDDPYDGHKDTMRCYYGDSYGRSVRSRDDDEELEYYSSSDPDDPYDAHKQAMRCYSGSWM